MNRRTLAKSAMILFLAAPLHAQQSSTAAFKVLTGATVAATAFDIESTMTVLKRCTTCFEANPMMRPFVSSRTSAYSAAMGISSASTWASYKLKQDERKWWWVPMVGQIGLHVVAGLHNQAISRSYR